MNYRRNVEIKDKGSEKYGTNKQYNRQIGCNESAIDQDKLYSRIATQVA